MIASRTKQTAMLDGACQYEWEQHEISLVGLVVEIVFVTSLVVIFFRGLCQDSGSMHRRQLSQNRRREGRDLTLCKPHPWRAKMLHAHNASALLRNENKASLRPIDMHARAFVASENNLMSSKRREGRKTPTVGNKWSSSSGSRFYANVVQRCSSGAGHEPRHSRSFISRVPSGERALLSRTPSNENYDRCDQESLEVREKSRSRSSMRPHVHRAPRPLRAIVALSFPLRGFSR